MITSLLMKHSDISQFENNFGIHVNSKSYSLTGHQMTTNNSNPNAVMIGSMISTQIISNSSTILTNALNTSKSNSSIIAKSCSTSTSTFNANMMSHLTYISPNNTAIKLVNLSKCQQLQSANKENPSAAANNSISVQFVTPILNNSSNLLNDCVSMSNSIGKIENSCVNNGSVVLSGSSNQTQITSNNSISCTRFILQSSQAPILPHGTVTLIPQHHDISNNNILNNNLIKNARYSLSGTKQTLQPIRPITSCTSSIISQPGVINKQAISKISSPKSLNNYTINMSDGNNSIAIKDLTTNKQIPISKDPHQKSSPMLTITSSNNIRLALTSNISNSKGNSNPSKIQFISPKTRIRSGSPMNLCKDGKLKDSLIESKDENSENPIRYNSQTVCYSPTRKRARKQHLKAVTNKLQKLASNNKPDSGYIINNILHNSIDKTISTPVTIAPTTTKFACITTHNKSDDSQTKTATTPMSNSSQIIIPLKNPIHICTSKVQSLATIYAGQFTSNNGIMNSTKTPGNITNQVQIISQNSQVRPVQLSTISQNLIMSPTLGKSLTNISPQKVIHIAPSKITNNFFQTVKNEKIMSDSLNNPTSVKEDAKRINNNNKEIMKLEIAEIRSEASDDLNTKYSLFPQKYHWNARRTHFEKRSDVKIKKSKMSSSCRYLNSENQEDDELSSDTEIYDTSWCLYKASAQFLLQKSFDEENLRNFHKLKEKFNCKYQTNHDDNDEPVFHKVCLKSQQLGQLPDQIDVNSFSDFTDPRLFGISDEIIDNHINPIPSPLLLPDDRTSKENSHKCSESCIFYLYEMPTIAQPPHILRILDLIEGLIVKEKKIIEKESEINDQCLRLLECSDSTPLIVNKNQKRTQNGRRW